MKLLLAINPHAGGKRALKSIPEVKKLFSEFNCEIELVFSEYPSFFTNYIANANLSLYNGIIAAGGDGTLFEVANGWMKNTTEIKPPIGILPIGTGNSFSMEMNIANNNLRKAVEIIAANKPELVDLGHCQTANSEFFFANILGTGFVCDVIVLAHKLKFLGKSAYNLAVLHQILFLQNRTVELLIDGKTIKQKNLLIEISNTKYTGKDYLMAPEASFNDGFLDVIIAEKMSRLKLLNLFIKLFKGEHIFTPEVQYLKAKHIEIKSIERQPLSPDGELLGTLPAVIKCIPKALPVFV